MEIHGYAHTHLVKKAPQQQAVVRFESSARVCFTCNAPALLAAVPAPVPMLVPEPMPAPVLVHVHMQLMRNSCTLVLHLYYS